MRERKDYSSYGEAIEPPYLLKDQKESYERFLNEGLEEVFEEISPVKASSRTEFKLEFTSPKLGEIRGPVEDCADKDLTYDRPLRITARLYDEDDNHVMESELYVADIPVMTPKGTFLINGSENVLVNELARAPGVYITEERNNQFRAHILPDYGAWLELILDDNRQRLYANLDREAKVPMTVFLKVLGMDREDIYSAYSFDLNPVTESSLKKYVGYKFAEDVTRDSEVLFEAGETLREEDVEVILNEATNESLSFLNAYIGNTLERDDFETKEEAVRFIYGKLRPTGRVSTTKMENYIKGLFFEEENYLLSEVGRFKANSKLGLDKETLALTTDDILNSLDLLLQVPGNPELLDEKDHLANKVVNLPGQAARSAFERGLNRVVRTTEDKLSKFSLDDEDTLRDLVPTRPIQSSVNQFFYTGRFSQFLEETNALAELTHKRRLNALGGGLSQRRAKLEVRDVHPSHYSRICPIETPEGQNIGLITSLANYARVNEYGFLEAPYRVVEDGKVTGEIEYIMAGEEEQYKIAPSTTKIDEDGNLIEERVEIRTGKENLRMGRPEEVDYVGVSPKAIVGTSASLIPFLEHDDANRALMGANMQRQGVPIVNPESPRVGTGMEEKAAKDSGMLVLADDTGEVTYVDADKIKVEDDNGSEKTYNLKTFTRSNQDTLVHQRPLVSPGDEVKEEEVLADGSTSEQGELALGRNLRVAFMPFEGYNYEDAIVVSERLVKEDMLDSIHIEEFEVKAEETKLGPEEITADIPNISKEDLKNLDSRGIIREGTEVETGDVLVGKITPKGESEPSPEEKIFRSIFGEQARNVKDSSLKLPPTAGKGKVIRVKKFSREKGHELDTGVNELVKVYVATRKKISIGDKLAGRHGNKGVIAKILPEEDMPFMPDGTPIDVLLNPLGVPSRMNLGQVFETHLGWLSSLKDEHVSTPVFDGAKEDEILQELDEEQTKQDLDEGANNDGKVFLRDGRTGELFDKPITVGYMYLLKLEHIADEKLHARSTGPYALITQQPLGGKAQFGGQRFGEMEVWALEAYGAASTLQEMLTLKSDDIQGRTKLYKAILKNEEMPKPGIPESFKVLVRELRSLGLSPKALDAEGNALNLS
ncbi:MAG: DNA-directed RNA polymerase subunit beta [Candidatus Bipolaricaulota bacterium]|nr:DNA-directed RNA polymerase subunit beta [Candidatus Bipolaricaulota bacterium]MBS3791714.1 DNA-directed RNA polymerase subunit beta [Candidatus Bipolaricaulota bacterium]